MPDIETPIPASQNFEKLKAKLRELFELDKADLDFGIYRVLRQRHTEITEFLDKHLEKTVRNALIAHGDVQNVQLKHDLEKAEAAAAGAGIAPEQSPKVMELRDKLGKGADLDATADEVYSHLLTFFSRYYQDGDFLGLQRSTVHGREKYMIPYNGEEVKLVWANMDQYYIKSSELLRDYTFRIRKADLATGELNLNDLPAESVVRFKLVEGDTEKDNRKPDGKTTRAFALDAEKPFEEEGETLTLRFRYREHTSERNLQDKLNDDTEKTLADSLSPRWKTLLFAADPTHQPKDKKDTRTVLQKHLRGYTAKFSFDYFIHKDLGGFLRRELDFYVKNEVMHLDDIEGTTAPKAEEYLSKIRAIRRCAMPVIQMIAQLEDFQKKLWLKKKFVVETRYCLTLDRVPETLYPEICTTDAQWREWNQLLALDEMKPKRTPEFLKANPSLMIDTRHFTREFTLKLLASIENLDASLGGVCFHSENFQALQLMQERYREQVRCIHIDPPYNTASSGFLYKNNYQHSSWVLMLKERVDVSCRLLSNSGVLAVHIDEYEQERLHILLDGTPTENAGTLIWDKGAPVTGSDGLAIQHEYVLFRTKGKVSIRVRKKNLELIKEKALELLAEHSGSTSDAIRDFRSWIRSCKSLSKAEKTYDQIDGEGVVFRSDNMSATEKRTDPKFYIPLIHPLTSQPCPVPEYGWRYTPESLDELVSKGLVLFGEDHTSTPRKKTTLENTESSQLASVYTSGMRGKAWLDNLGLEFPFSHPLDFYETLIAAASLQTDYVVLDFFGGSGTSGHAIVNLNRDDNGSRNYILVEMGEHFETVLVPRLKKVVYSSDWSQGKPQAPETGISHAFKIVRLEGYEDALNNLHLRRTPEQAAALAQGGETNRDQYLHGYFLEVESAGSASLLDMKQFRDPFSYKLQIATSSAGETKETTVDLVETFNWLLGLKVKNIDTAKGFLTVTGEKRAGGRCLILWRTLTDDPKADNEALEKFLIKLAVNPADTEFDFIYVNGAHTLNDPHNKVHLIEETFQRLMFDTTNFETLS